VQSSLNPINRAQMERNLITHVCPF